MTIKTEHKKDFSVDYDIDWINLFKKYPRAFELLTSWCGKEMYILLFNKNRKVYMEVVRFLNLTNNNLGIYNFFDNIGVFYNFTMDENRMFKIISMYDNNTLILNDINDRIYAIKRMMDNNFYLIEDKLSSTTK